MIRWRGTRNGCGVDVRDEMVSEPVARDVYGVVIADGAVDSSATESHRRELRGGR